MEQQETRRSKSLSCWKRTSHEGPLTERPTQRGHWETHRERPLKETHTVTSNRGPPWETPHRSPHRETSSRSPDRDPHSDTPRQVHWQTPTEKCYTKTFLWDLPHKIHTHTGTEISGVLQEPEQAPTDRCFIAYLKSLSELAAQKEYQWLCPTENPETLRHCQHRPKWGSLLGEMLRKFCPFVMSLLLNKRII